MDFLQFVFFGVEGKKIWGVCVITYRDRVERGKNKETKLLWKKKMNRERNPPKTSAVPPRTAEFLRRMRKHGEADAAMTRHASRYKWPENVVVQMRITDEIDLRRISASRHNAYIPHRFETFTVRYCDQSNTTVLLFHTGKAVLVGTRAPEYTFQGAHRTRMDLAALGNDVAFEEFSLVNQVYNVTLVMDTGIDLGKLLQENMEKTEWDPFLFPGEKYKDVESNVIIRFFDTKIAVIMGAKDESTIEDIIARVVAIAKRYPDKNLPNPENRFEYRNEKKRLACSIIPESKMVLPGSADSSAQPKLPNEFPISFQ
jgi:TATA-box binding protein (TBP) (component of TFIID and TFIIIB)